ncbi:hypothetical protein [Brachybacterium sp. ACRRE]|uniref:GntT/GntP/DsdX family permease n=1 Tax=Brachybacterium sp. ACRRE TaxID=2918184 RepID=UPI00351CD094
MPLRGAPNPPPLLFVGLPLTAGLYVAHGLLPPHPSPTAAVGAVHAGFGMTDLSGIIIEIPRCSCAESCWPTA